MGLGTNKYHRIPPDEHQGATHVRTDRHDAFLIDLEQPVDRHWCGGDAFLTAWFNALSMSFPVGEQFFIDAVRDGFKTLPAERQPAFQADVQGFVGQEATHRRIHSLFNAQIARHGLVNEWEPRAVARLKATQGADVRHALGITAANEHFTALFAEWLLSRPALLDGADPRLKTIVAVAQRRRSRAQMCGL